MIELPARTPDQPGIIPLPKATLRVSRTVDDIIAEAAALPLRDAAYLIWREKTTFEGLELRRWKARDMSTPGAAARAMQEISAELKHEHDTAQDGPTFDRLKRAHPHPDDAELKQAIVAAVKFDDDCFRYFSYGSGEAYLENVALAVTRAQRTIRPIWKRPTAMPGTGSPTT